MHGSFSEVLSAKFGKKVMVKKMLKLLLTPFNFNARANKCKTRVCVKLQPNHVSKLKLNIVSSCLVPHEF